MKSDIELVEDVKAGDRRAFSELVQRHQRALLRLSLRFLREPSLAEDVVQESFIKAYEKIHLFEGRSSFKSWLFQIAVNTAKNRLRSLPHEFVNIDDVHLGIDPGAENGMVREDLRKVIRSEVDRLPERQRLALSLRIFEDLSFKEIAQIMACPYDTAKANYRHGLMRLKERLETLQGQTDWEDFETMLPVEGGRMRTEVEQ
ncbi:MAG: sigma-70 family RNA polymerase sigma factor [Bdellovibrionaceae bacterium]|nr:sigma-70 family RNA polymerase sigma factor [Pseudobdellovibrionaceae bacterium]